MRNEIMNALGHAPDAVIPDGNIHRFGVSRNSSKKPFWYIVFLNGDYGICGDWRSGETVTLHSDRFNKLPRAERQRALREIKYTVQQQAKERAEKQKQTAQLARQAVATFEPATEAHPYLVRKGNLPPCGALLDGRGNLVIPMYYGFFTPQVVSYQRIFPNGEKLFLNGGQKAGCYFPIGNDEAGPLIICEGFATGVSIHQMTGHDVVVAFDAGNLMAVAKSARRAYSTRRIIIACDDDYQRRNSKGELENIGIIKGREAAMSINGEWVIPQFGENRPEGATDYNDYYQMLKQEAIR